MKREDLKAKGLTDEQIDFVMGENGKDIEKIKVTADTAKTEAETINGQLAEANKVIEGFKGMNVDQIKASADEWKTKAEQAEAARIAEVAQVKFNYALDGALSGAKAKDTISVRAHLKNGDLKLNEDGTIPGLNEQLETLKASHGHLFEDTTPTPRIVTGGTNTSMVEDSFVAAMRKGAGLSK